jgi:ubiquitin carboxyl-terminal hydrolase 9/24
LLVRFIEDNRILEALILGENLHAELIKRSTEIVLFLCRNNAFDANHFDYIWSQIHEKHESIALAFYHFLNALCDKTLRTQF